MADDSDTRINPADFMNEILRMQGEAVSSMFGQLGAKAQGPGGGPGGAGADGGKGVTDWTGMVQRLQSMWQDYAASSMGAAVPRTSPYFSPAKWTSTAEDVVRQLPLTQPEIQKHLWEETLALMQGVLGQYGIGPGAGKQGEAGDLPRSDRRFADPAWRDSPFFAVLHQTYLMLSEQLLELAQSRDDLEPAKRQQLIFSTRMLTDALSPSNFPVTNPVILQRAAQTGGESLIKGMRHLLSDLKRGQLTHSPPEALELGTSIAVTPGKVIHQTPLYQLIQYTPVTDEVMTTPLVIFPPWINRFYILDLNAKKSFVRWATEQGISVFMVSWKSADETMGDVTWDDYIAAQIEAVDVVRERLRVPSAHTIGYCVAGTTLAATLAVLARRGEADKVKSATFFTAQVDFEDAGDLKSFIDDMLIEAIPHLAHGGVFDGRYLAATFNMLRGNDLIWDYVVRNYLKGEDHPTFDLLHWNGDYTNMPARWYTNYLRDLYRDNRMVVPDSLSVQGVPLDLRRIETPCYIQAGKEDHIAPPQSVWKLTRHVKGPWTFLLAGSGHIAGVVNPPAAGKYQYWINEGPAESLDEFVAGATEHPGSWWPHWLDWIRQLDPTTVKVKGKRRPGGRGDKVIEDAPGTYVKTR